VKEALGHATNDPDLEVKGKAEKVGGKIQKKVGDRWKGPRKVDLSTEWGRL
jgi:uncharacterized protein YjbJ (UPF0337 family)